MCYYTGGETRKKNWMDEKLFSVSTAKDLFVHCPKSGHGHISGLNKIIVTFNILKLE